MKLRTTVRLTGALLAGVLLSLFTANAFAANTTAGTSITNIAIAGYSVNGTAQNSVCSSPTGNSTSTGSTSTSLGQCTSTVGQPGTGVNTSFVVDDKLLLTVTTVDAADVNVTPGQTAAVLVFKVTNSGNATQGVTFAALQEAAGTLASTAGAGFTGTDNFDTAATPQVFVSANNTTTYVPANDTASSIPQLPATGTNFNYVFIVTNIPAGQVDADVAVLALRAQVAAAGGSATYGTAPGSNITTDDSGNPWTAGTQQNIFADTTAGTDDGTLDGKASSRDVFLVKSAKLTITKSSSVVSDPTGDATPHAIPGAVMKFTILVTNSGTSAATGITLADSISSQLTNITYVTNSITLTDPNVNSGNPLSCADAGSSGGSFGSDTCSFTSGTSTVNALINSLTNGQTATVTFNVTIN